MTLHCAFIGFGKSTTRYHLPYVLHRKDRWQVAHIYRRRAKPEEQAPQYSHIHFTSDLDEVLNDPLVKLVVVCTHADSHFEYAKKALEAGKNVLVEKPFTPTLEEAKTLFALANSKGLTVTPYQNRRFDSCFLTTKKVIESGKLGELVEIESHFDNYRPLAETNPGGPQNGEFYGLGVHTLDQNISLFGRPDHVSYDLRSLRNKANPDDTFEAQLFYGDMKAIVKTSHLVQIDYPKFIVHGHKGSFVKYGIDQQETSLKANIMPASRDLARTTALASWCMSTRQGRWCAKRCRWRAAIMVGCTTRCTTPSSTASRITSRKLTFSPIWRSCSAALSSLHRPPLPLPDKSNWLLCACSYFLNRGVNFHPL